MRWSEVKLNTLKQRIVAKMHGYNYWSLRPSRVSGCSELPNKARQWEVQLFAIVVLAGKAWMWFVSVWGEKGGNQWQGPPGGRCREGWDKTNISISCFTCKQGFDCNTFNPCELLVTRAPIVSWRITEGMNIWLSDCSSRAWRRSRHPSFCRIDFGHSFPSPFPDDSVGRASSNHSLGSLQ
jgi:hypothetical protein